MTVEELEPHVPEMVRGPAIGAIDWLIAMLTLAALGLGILVNL